MLGTGADSFIPGDKAAKCWLRVSDSWIFFCTSSARRALNSASAWLRSCKQRKALSRLGRLGPSCGFSSGLPLPSLLVALSQPGCATARKWDWDWREGGIQWCQAKSWVGGGSDSRLNPGYVTARTWEWDWREGGEFSDARLHPGLGVAMAVKKWVWLGSKELNWNEMQSWRDGSVMLRKSGWHRVGRICWSWWHGNQ